MEDERRKRALRYLNITGVVQGVLGLLLLFLGLAAQLKHGSYADGVPPYYTGAYIGMAVIFVQAGLGLAIFIRGKDCINKLEASEKIGCIMQTYCFMAIIGEIGYLVASLLLGFTGVCDNSHCSYIDTGENRRLAIAILVFICVGVVTSAIGLAIVCKYSSSFGLKMLSRGQYQISNLVDNTDAVIAYIAAEQTASTDMVENQQPVNHQEHHHHNHYQDPRLTYPTHDYSTEHLQHYLTQQYRDRIRKRRKKNRKRKRDNQQEGGERRRRRNGREAPYVLPPLSAPSGNYDHQPRSPARTPPPPPPSPPHIPVHYPPPSSSPSETKSPPYSRRTPPLTPSTLALPDIIPPSESPPPYNPYTPSPSPTPPLNHPGIIHVIPCGETLDEDLSPYSP